MDTTTRPKQSPNFFLSPYQQDLLLTALNSNKSPRLLEALPASTNPGTMALAPSKELSLQSPDAGALAGLDDSPFVDYDYDFDADAGFDYDFANDTQGRMIGKLPGSSSDGDAETHDKRGHPDDEDNDEDGGGKRREGDEKSSKKPGRKPLTSEPTSKRKAQNRAAQRAFRERKEKHLKDLETKVEDLEKASESANHENSILRVQVEKLTVELREYRKRLLPTVNSRSSLNGGLPPYLAGKSSNSNTNRATNTNDVNFHFEFPKFGELPRPPVLNGSSSIEGAPMAPTPAHRASSSSSISPFDQTLLPINFSPISSEPNKASISSDAPLFPLNGADISNFSDILTPSGLESFTNGYSPDPPAPNSNASRSSSDSAHGANSTGHNTNYSSPSASSNVGSNAGLSSSCGTSPEPYTMSPGTFKSNDNLLSTIGEEHATATSEGEASFCEKMGMACGSPKNPIPRTMSKSGVTSGNLQNPGFDFKTPNFELNGIDWFAQQNGNQFDPQLFGDYREPQNNVLTGGLYDDTFFAEAFSLPEFSSNSPFNVASSPAPAIAPVKKDLVQEIDQRLNRDEEVVPGEDRTKLLSCNSMWEKLQSCPSIQNGSIDMDDLCSQLQSKAKCSGGGPVINEIDFTNIIHGITKKEKA